MKVEDFDYELPEELISQSPYKQRDMARLMIVQKDVDEFVKNKENNHLLFKDILDYLNPGDCLVINDTKVIPARIYGKKKTGSVIEILLLKQLQDKEDTWQVLVKPGSKAKIGATIYFGDVFDKKDDEIAKNAICKCEIVDIIEDGIRIAKFSYDGIFNEILDQIGIMPLPPYITKQVEDNDDYQTVYAKYQGSVAAPTAGLHFTKELLDKIEKKGVKIAKVTLHVGIGTFRPVSVSDVNDHKMHSEEFVVTKEACDIVNECKQNGGKIIAVGTTSLRTLESSCENGKLVPKQGATDIFIYPGYKFQITDNLITNFHLPKSTLLMLVSAISSRETIREAYLEAVKKKYKFFSFGDAMYIM